MQRLNPKKLKLESNNVVVCPKVMVYLQLELIQEIFSTKGAGNIRKSLAILPNFEHGKPLNARQPNEISQV